MQLKFRVMEIYNEKLDERIRRKNFVIDRKLLDTKEQGRVEKGKSKEEKEIFNMMKPFARFSSEEDHKSLVQGIVQEKQIRQRIEDLRKLQSQGYSTLAEVQTEMEEKRKQEELDIDNCKKDIASRSRLTRKTKKDLLREKGERKLGNVTAEEGQICQRFGITARQYLLIKETILRETVRQGIIEREWTVKMFKIERSVIDGIFDFMIERKEITAFKRA